MAACGLRGACTISPRAALFLTRCTHTSHLSPRAAQSDRSDKLVLTSTGTGGLDELREHLDEGKASYAYVRIRYSNDKESQREKFILVVWIGPSCKIMRKAKVSLLLHVCRRCNAVDV